ncbi:hypothetical protein N7537_010559 [Penicillium hordei]|uniref:Uncharacterized protein n=1 Tax=Penicillium hordei TaxID=40994 RepID=A0AAD6GY68_9EURO|nr:uncharacterized protein N7537_010559 [Penicillium hordei]KAJ5593655.1 hypothetical protein N7537_010559 [Penicillium hordei]
MEQHHHLPLSFEEFIAFQRSESLAEYEAWGQAVVQYNQQLDEQSDATTLANTSTEIPLGESTRLDHPPVNAAGENHILIACKPDDPIAHERVRENTERLINSGVVTKLCIDRTFEVSLLERTETSGALQDNAETDKKRAREAHMRFWSAFRGSDKDIENSL